MSTFSRRSFLKTAGVATGAALIGGVPAAAGAAGEHTPEIVVKPSPLPQEPLVAYVRDARKGEVTVVSGLRETTVRDPLLAKRIEQASRRHPAPRPRHRLGEVA